MCMTGRYGVQWKPSITETIGKQLLTLIVNSGASGIFPVGVVLRNCAVEHNVAVFLGLSFAVRWEGALSRG